MDVVFGGVANVVVVFGSEVTGVRIDDVVGMVSCMTCVVVVSWIMFSIGAI